jgi:ribose transport system ATP-binding protein
MTGTDSLLLKMDGIAKRFGRTVALSDVTLGVGRGEVHALVGENGAGKSTLMKVLAGAEKADAGAITFDGRPFTPHEPRDALAAGIAMVYQEFNLAPHLTVEANLLLGRERAAGGFFLAGPLSGLAGGEERRRCRAALDRLGMRVSLDDRVGELGVADQQMIEIARALLGGARLVIMDEPTSALAAHEVQSLFAIIRQLRADGISIIYISHFLEELEQIADRLSVLRDGRTVATGALSDWPRERIIEAMVGRKVEEMYPRMPHAIGAPLLVVRDLAGLEAPRQASLTLHRGEVLGIAGLVGAGRTEMLRTLFGLDPRRGGQATLNGVRVERFSPADWKARGVGLLSEDRKAEGLAQDLSCLDNITLPAVSRDARLGWIGPRQGYRAARALGHTLRIKWDTPEQKVSSLSGGNQQKVALARLLYTDADVLLLDEPTRGIDVGAKVDLYRVIGELACRGKAVVIVSSYLPELFGICDRIAVMSRGVLAPAQDVSALTPETVMHLAVGE